MPQGAGAAMGSQGWLRPISCRKCSHKCSSFNGLRVRKIRRPQMAYKRGQGHCATQDTSDPNLLSEPRIWPVRRCTSRPCQDRAAGTPPRRPHHRPRACAPYAQGPAFLGAVFGRIAGSAELRTPSTSSLPHARSMSSGDTPGGVLADLQPPARLCQEFSRDRGGTGSPLRPLRSASMPLAPCVRRTVGSRRRLRGGRIP